MGYDKMVELLIQAKVGINLQDNEGVTALHLGLYEFQFKK